MGIFWKYYNMTICLFSTISLYNFIHTLFSEQSNALPSLQEPSHNYRSASISSFLNSIFSHNLLCHQYFRDFFPFVWSLSRQHFPSTLFSAYPLNNRSKIFFHHFNLSYLIRFDFVSKMKQIIRGAIITKKNQDPT